VEASSFAILARPVAADDWTLVVLEQLRPRPFCWTPRPDGLVDPSLNRFDYTGICGRFIDSNGYSLRIGEVDFGHAYRLRLERQGRTLRLLATTAARGAELVVGRGTVLRRDRDLFVPLQLEPGWELRRRMFAARSLNHVYFSNGQPLDTLVAAARGRGPVDTDAPAGGGFPLPLAAPPPPIATGSPREPMVGFRREEPLSPREARSQARSRPPVVAPLPESRPAGDTPAAGVVALQVIPYVDRGGASERYSSAQGQ
jgi:hypothetical protein